MLACECVFGLCVRNDRCALFCVPFDVARAHNMHNVSSLRNDEQQHSSDCCLLFICSVDERMKFVNVADRGEERKWYWQWRNTNKAEFKMNVHQRNHSRKNPPKKARTKTSRAVTKMECTFVIYLWWKSSCYWSIQVVMLQCKALNYKKTHTYYQKNVLTV